MKCDQIKVKFSEYLTGEIDEVTHKEVQEHVTECSSCRTELENVSAIWTKLEVLPEEQPGSDVRSRFYSMLEEYKQSLEQKTERSGLRSALGRKFERWMLVKPTFQLSSALILLLVGLTAGYFLHANLQRGEEMAQLKQELSMIRQIASVSLLRQESLTEQLRAVGMTPRSEQLDRETLDALLRFISNDTDLNLRLDSPAIPSPFQGYPLVNQEFVQALSEQASPLVEVALSLMGPRF